MGSRVLDEILPPLISNLEDSDPSVSRMALNGLRQMLAVRSNIVLPFVVPKLVTPPLTLFSVKSLASVAEVSGSALYSYIHIILPALFEGMFNSDDNPASTTDEEVVRAAHRIVVAVGQDGVSLLIGELTKLAHATDNKKQRRGMNIIRTIWFLTPSGACLMIGAFAQHSKANFVPQLPV